jgi:4a-hydroxytetrahydrobiopterin dehydratase
MMNTEMDFLHKRCIPCEGGVPRIEPQQAAVMVRSLKGWRLDPEAPDRIEKTFAFQDFRAAMVFVNAMAALAESEGHHPDFGVHYSKVHVALWTHAIGGLSENDFILAAKLDALPAAATAM